MRPWEEERKCSIDYIKSQLVMHIMDVSRASPDATVAPTGDLRGQGWKQTT